MTRTKHRRMGGAVMLGVLAGVLVVAAAGAVMFALGRACAALARLAGMSRRDRAPTLGQP